MYFCCNVTRPNRFLFFNYMAEEKPIHVGQQILAQRSSTMGHVLTTFLVLGHAYIKKKINIKKKIKDIVLWLVMLKSATY